jgi:hypothetical protein
MTASVAVSESPRAEPRRLVRIVLTVVVIVPIVTAVVRALRRDWFAVGDDALLYIRVRDVLTHHHPWLGSWTSASRSLGVDLNNPGPIYADLLAPFAHLLPPGPGAAIGVGFANALSIVAISAAAHRLGGWALQRWALLACGALTWAMGSQLLFDIWQAHALLLPFLLYLLVLMGLATGDVGHVRWTVPSLVALGSLLIQTHLSYVYVLALLSPVAVAAAIVARRRQRVSPSATAAIWASVRSRTAAWSAGLFLILWTQPLVEQFAGDGEGNLSRLASSAGGGEVTVGFRTAAQIVASVMALPPWWTRGGFSTVVPTTTRIADTPDGPRVIVAGMPSGAVTIAALLALVAVLVLLWRATRRCGDRLAAAGCAVALGLVAAAWLSLAVLTVGTVGLSAHHVRWVWPAAVFVHLVIVVAAARLALHRFANRPLDRALSAIAVLGVGVLMALNIPYLAQQEGPVADEEATVALRQVFTQLEPLRSVAPVVYDTSNLRVFEPYSTAVMMELQELGIEFRVDDEVMVRQLGPSRRADGTEQATVFQLEGSEALLYRGEACLLARADGVDELTRRRADAVVDTLVSAVQSGRVTVDRTAIDPTTSALLDAAATDNSAALRLVYEGHLLKWLDTGAAELDASTADQVAGSDGTTTAFGAIGATVISTYALFVEPATVCAS